MALVVRLTETGGLDTLKLVEEEKSAPGYGEVWIEQHAIGVNPLDVSQRKGAVPLKLPSGLGLEGAGEITAVGPGVENFLVGDRVGYATGPVGAYASGRIFPAERLILLPDSLSYEGAASLLFKGITAQYLLKTTFPVTKGSRILVYGASGGVGQIMVPWAKYLGAQVIGVVSKQSSVERAKRAGCDEVLVFDAASLPEQVMEVTSGHKVDVVYDGVGRASFEASLNSLRPRGLMVSYGMTSGAPLAVEIATLNAKGSLFLTRPSLGAHTATAAEYQRRAADVLKAYADWIIRPNPCHEFKLSNVAQAHELLESGSSQGAVILRS
ncbi:quinone oxidoreductase [Pseudomonas sp. BN411]|uniref:quinone oxidoreductase family protein n=1 Tax=Pseudomonas sp. BN411 TaxID=2567887 RepID=UPI0024570BFF|nr:quinone oxidoreductase [Pseudomonas sp. BN411]MDH4564230.1 quinone oxidoreductase [Pseudomonas sp. BN411]